MGKIVAGISLLFMLSQMSLAQEPVRLIQVDRESYELYLKNDWKELIKVGNEALDAGIDFFYLRLRLGIAWYALGRFEKSKNQLLAALQQVPNDPVALYYLYAARLYSGRTGDARRMGPALRKHGVAGIKIPAAFSLSGIYGEAGVFSNGSVAELTSGMPEGNFVSSYFSKSMSYLNASIGLNLGYASHLVVSFNQFNSFNLQVIRQGNEWSELDHKSNQSGLYMRYQYNLPNSGYAGFAWHKIGGSYSYTYLNDSGGQAGSLMGSSVDFEQDYLGAFIGKRLHVFDLRMQLSRNRFWQGTRIQAGMNAYWYLFGSLDHYLQLGYDRMYTTEANSSYEEAVKLEAGIKLYRGFYLSGSHLFGNLSNWADGNGYYLFNTVYPIRSRTGMRLLINGILPQLQLSLSAYWQNREHYADSYLQNGTVESLHQNYSNTSIFGGLSWTF